MPTKTPRATRQSNRARELDSAVRGQGDAAAAKLEAIFTPLLENGEVSPDWQLVQKLIARLAAGHGREVEAGVLAYHAAASSMLAQRTRLHDAVQELRRHLSPARELLVRLYPAGPGIWLTQKNKPVSRLKPMELVRAGRQLVKMLRKRDFEFPQVVGSLPLPEPRAWADQIEPAVAALEAALDQEMKAREVEVARRDSRNRGVAGARKTLKYASALLLALHRLAGFHQGLTPLRPRRRRRPASSPSPKAG